MRTVDAYISTLEKKARFLPPSLMKEVEDFIDFLLSKNKKRPADKPKGKLSAKFAGKLSPKVAEDIHEQVAKSRNEWNSNT